MTNGWIDIKTLDMMLIMAATRLRNQPVLVSMASGSEAASQRQNDRGRSSLTPVPRPEADLFLANTGPAPTSLSRPLDQLRAAKQSESKRITSSTITKRGVHLLRTDLNFRKMDCSQVSTRREHLRTISIGTMKKRKIKAANVVDAHRRSKVKSEQKPLSRLRRKMRGKTSKKAATRRTSSGRWAGRIWPRRSKATANAAANTAYDFRYSILAQYFNS